MMKERYILLTLLFLLLPLTVSAQKNKLSLWLRQQVELSADQSVPMRRSGEELEPDKLTTVFVRTSETLTPEMLQEYGGTIYAQLGDISIVTIPMSQIDKLIESPSVLRVEANRRADVTLDTVVQVNNILPV